MDNFLNHSFDWLIVLGLLAGAAYTMRVIRRESSTMRDESVPVPFQGLILHVPKWWTQTRFEETQIQFERTDTRYDWYGRFSWIENTAEKSLPDLLNEKIEADELDYDKDDVTIETDGRVIFRHDPIREKFIQVIRVEGKASEKIENRVYLDLCLFRSPDRAGYFLFESRSSVLNGMVEGPYFEEVLGELEVALK